MYTKGKWCTFKGNAMHKPISFYMMLQNDSHGRPVPLNHIMHNSILYFSPVSAKFINSNLFLFLFAFWLTPTSEVPKLLWVMTHFGISLPSHDPLNDIKLCTKDCFTNHESWSKYTHKLYGQRLEISMFRRVN